MLTPTQKLGLQRPLNGSYSWGGSVNTNSDILDLAIGTQHNLDGTHKDITATNIAVSGDILVGGVPLSQNLRNAYTNRGVWVTTTLYNVNDQFIHGSITYLVTVAHTSGVFASDQISGFFIIQQGELYLGQPSFAGAVLQSDVAGVRSWLYSPTTGFESLLTAAEIADAKTGVPTIDLTAKFQAFFASITPNAVLSIPPWTYLCADLATIAPVITIHNVTINAIGATIIRPNATGVGTGNYAWSFTNFFRIEVNGAIFKRLNTVTANTSFNGVLFTDCDYAVCNFCDFSDCLWGMVSGGVSRFSKAYQCFSDSSVLVYSAAAFDAKQHPEFIYRVFGTAGSKCCYAIECYSNGASMVFQPNGCPYSKSIRNVSVNCWNSAIYGASDYFESREDVVISGGKDGIKINTLFTGAAAQGGLITGAVVMGVGIHRSDGGQNIAMSAVGGRVRDCYVQMSMIANGAASEQNGVSIQGNYCSADNNTVFGAIASAQEGSAFMIRGRHFINNVTAINVAFGGRMNRGIGNMAVNTLNGVSFRNSSDTLLPCLDNEIDLICKNVPYPVDAFSDSAITGLVMDRNSASVNATGASIVFKLIGTSQFRCSGTVKSADVTGAKNIFSLSSAINTSFENITSDGTYLNYSSVDAASSIAGMKNVVDYNVGKNLSQRILSASTATIFNVGNTEIKHNIATVGALTLENGTHIFQTKLILATFIAAGFSTVITGLFLVAGVVKTTATLSASQDILDLRWNGLRWDVVRSNNVVFA